MNQSETGPEQRDDLVKSDAPATDEPKRPLNEITSSMREFAQKLPGSISAAIQSALSPRDHSVTAHIGESASKSLDLLVDAGVFGSRSEAAEFLINEGIKAQGELFERIAAKLQQIDSLRAELKSMIDK